jgi:cholesterol transport system auxiliary component
MSIRSGFVLAACMALGGCSGLQSRTPPTEIYLLQPAMPGAAAPAASAGGASAAAGELPTLAVLTPVVTPGLDNERIALIQADGRLDSFAASRWPADLQQVLVPLLVDALRAGGRFRAVHSETEPFNADYVLQLEVRQFAADYAGGAAVPTARVQFVATLARSSNRVPVRSIRVEQSAAAAANRMTAVVRAFNQATGAAFGELVAGVAVGQ